MADATDKPVQVSVSSSGGGPGFGCGSFLGALVLSATLLVAAIIIKAEPQTFMAALRAVGGEEWSEVWPGLTGDRRDVGELWTALVQVPGQGPMVVVGRVGGLPVDDPDQKRLRDGLARRLQLETGLGTEAIVYGHVPAGWPPEYIEGPWPRTIAVIEPSLALDADASTAELVVRARWWYGDDAEAETPPVRRIPWPPTDDHAQVPSFTNEYPDLVAALLQAAIEQRGDAGLHEARWFARHHRLSGDAARRAQHVLLRSEDRDGIDSLAEACHPGARSDHLDPVTCCELFLDAAAWRLLDPEQDWLRAVGELRDPFVDRCTRTAPPELPPELMGSPWNPLPATITRMNEQIDVVLAADLDEGPIHSAEHFFDLGPAERMHRMAATFSPLRPADPESRSSRRRRDRDIDDDPSSNYDEDEGNGRPSPLRRRDSRATLEWLEGAFDPSVVLGAPPWVQLVAGTITEPLDACEALVEGPGALVDRLQARPRVERRLLCTADLHPTPDWLRPHAAAALHLWSARLQQSPDEGRLAGALRLPRTPEWQQLAHALTLGAQARTGQVGEVVRMLRVLPTGLDRSLARRGPTDDALEGLSDELDRTGASLWWEVYRARTVPLAALLDAAAQDLSAHLPLPGGEGEVVTPLSELLDHPELCFGDLATRCHVAWLARGVKTGDIVDADVALDAFSELRALQEHPSVRLPGGPAGPYSSSRRRRRRDPGQDLPRFPGDHRGPDEMERPDLPHGFWLAVQRGQAQELHSLLCREDLRGDLTISSVPSAGPCLGDPLVTASLACVSPPDWALDIRRGGRSEVTLVGRMVGEHLLDELTSPDPWDDEDRWLDDEEEEEEPQPTDPEEVARLAEQQRALHSAELYLEAICDPLRLPRVYDPESRVPEGLRDPDEDEDEDDPWDEEEEPLPEEEEDEGIPEEDPDPDPLDWLE